MSERIQKALAASGIVSRRLAETWIAAGRVTVNGYLATLGQAIGPRDRVAIDGRAVRIDWREDRIARGVVYHRAPGEGIKEATDAGDESVFERLPKVHGGRWIAVSAMALGEGGLELFLSDGALVAALNKRSEEIPVEYSLRLRGAFDETRIEEILHVAAEDTEARGTIDLLEPAGGEGANRWARMVCRGLRPRDLKRIFERCGIELNRTLRTRFGPISMERALMRGRSRELTAAELQALGELAGMLKPVPKPEPRPASGKRTPRAGRPGRDDESQAPRAERPRSDRPRAPKKAGKPPAQPDDPRFRR